MTISLSLPPRTVVVGHRHCVRVREGGEVLDAVDSDRGAFACILSRGDEPRLFVVGQEWGEPDAMGGERPGGWSPFRRPHPAPGTPDPRDPFPDRKC